MSEMIEIRLEVYLPFRGSRIWRGSEQVPRGTRVGDLIELLQVSEPELAVLVNGRNLPEKRELEEGDEVAILRQAEGG